MSKKSQHAHARSVNVTKSEAKQEVTMLDAYRAAAREDDREVTDTRRKLATGAR